MIQLSLQVRTKAFEVVSLMEAVIDEAKAFCPTGPGGGIDPTCSPGGGMAGVTDPDKDGTRTLSNGKPIPEHIGYIPPAWTNVRISLDKDADLVATGFDANKTDAFPNGRSQRLYSDKHWTDAAKRKFGAVSELYRKESEIIQSVKKATKDPKTKEQASALRLIHHTGMRVGGSEDTGAKVQAYGATTLEGRHIVQDGDNVRLKFVGKKGVDQDVLVTDSFLVSDLLRRKSEAGDTGKLYNTDDGKVLRFVSKLDGGGFKTKDFRTLVGTKLALAQIKKMPIPKTAKDRKKSVNAVGDVVSAKLGNGRAQALESYIDPTVFSKWRVI